jgi:hypothetical protein
MAERLQLVAVLNVLTRVLVVPGDDSCAGAEKPDIRSL